MPKTKAPPAPAQISRRAMLGKIAVFAGAAYAAPAMLSLSQARASGGSGSSYSGGSNSSGSSYSGGSSSYSGSRGSSNSSFSNAGQRSRWPTWWQRS